MIKFFKKRISKRHWGSLSKKLNDSSLTVLDRAILAAEHFTKESVPLEGDRLLIYKKYYIRSPAYSLAMLLNDLQTTYDNFKASKSIKAISDMTNSSPIRFDVWCYPDTLYGYHELTPNSGYLRAARLILEINKLFDTNSERLFFERRCSKLLTSFILLTEFLGYLKYEI